MTAIHDMSAAEILAAYKTKKLSPVEVTDSVIHRIEAWEPKLKALYAPDFEGSLKTAKESEKRWQAGKPKGALDGVPITIKENIATRGVPVPLGTAASDMTPAAADAPAAARVREAGAIILAKTTMPDYGMLSSGLEPGRLERRRRCRGGGGLRPASSRHRHRRLGAPAGLLERHFHPEAQPRSCAGRSAVPRPRRRTDDAHRR
jgi:hypothetical protein